MIICNRSAVERIWHFGMDPTFRLLIVNTTGSKAKYGRVFSVGSCNTAMIDIDIREELFHFSSHPNYYYPPSPLTPPPTSPYILTTCSEREE
jgi:hypothetical protein